MRKKWNIHTFIPRLAAVLLMLVLVTTSMVTGRYARYTTSSSGSDSARVAAFKISQSVVQGETDMTATVPMPEIKPGETVNYTVVVNMDTEVAVRNTITVSSLYGNLPLQFKIGESGTDGTQGGTYSQDCQPGEYQKTYEASVTWPAIENSVNYIGMVDLLTITVTSEQID